MADSDDCDSYYEKIQDDIANLGDVLEKSDEEEEGEQVSWSEDEDKEEFGGKLSDLHNLETESELPSNVPVNVETAQTLNKAYQDAILDLMCRLDEALVENRQCQEELQEKLNSSVKKPKKNCVVKFLNIPKTKMFTTFLSPYFKDKRGFSHPPNDDTKQKILNEELDPLIRPPRIWTHAEKINLTEAVRLVALEKALHPLMAKKEFLSDKLNCEHQLLTDDKDNINEKIIATDKEIQVAKMQSVKDLFGATDKEHDWLKISTVYFEGSRSATDCELMWKIQQHPSINTNPWSLEEIKTIEVLHSKHGNDWETIAAELTTNRTASQCLECFQAYLNDELYKSKWTMQEDNRLKKVVQSFRMNEYIPWQKVAYCMEGRTQIQVQRRWIYHLNPLLRKGSWTEIEDIMLIAAYHKFGGNWSRIKNYVPGRTDSQCRERWCNTLDRSIRDTCWTKDEDCNLVKLARKLNYKWSEIAKHLPGRTDSMCSGRYNRIMYATRRKLPGEFIPHLDIIIPRTILRSSQWYRSYIYSKLMQALAVVNLKELGTGEVSPIENNVSKDSNVSHLELIKTQVEAEKILKAMKSEMGKARSTSNRGRKPQKLTNQDLDFIDFYRCGLTRVSKGRPPQTEVPLDDDKMKYENSVLGLLLQSMGSSIKSVDTNQDGHKRLATLKAALVNAEIPILPPTKATLTGFRNLLLNRCQLQQIAKQFHCMGLIATDRNDSSMPPTIQSTSVDFGNPEQLMDIPGNAKQNSKRPAEVSIATRAKRAKLSVEQAMDETVLECEPQCEPNELKEGVIPGTSCQGPNELKYSYSTEMSYAGFVSHINSTDSFKLLASRFISLFFWPALLATVKPHDLPTGQERAERRTTVRRKPPKKIKKPWVAKRMRELAHQRWIEQGKPEPDKVKPKGKRGRKPGSKPKPKLPPDFSNCRRSGRLTQS